MKSRYGSIRWFALWLLVAALSLAPPLGAFETVPDKAYGENWRTASPALAETLPAHEFWKTLDPRIPQKYFYYRPSLYLFVLRYPISKVAEGDSREFRNAVKAFQRDLGSKPTGVLTVAQYVTLEDRAAWLHTVWIDGWFGTPIIGDPQASSETSDGLLEDSEHSVSIGGIPISTESLRTERSLDFLFAECQKAWLRCVAAYVEADAWFGGPWGYDGPLKRSGFPLATPLMLDVNEWTDARIVASTPSGQERTLCLVVQRASGKVHMGEIAEAEPVTESAADVYRVPAGPGHVCVPHEEPLKLGLPEEVQRRTAQLYGKAARNFIADWNMKDKEYQDALREAKQRAASPPQP